MKIHTEDSLLAHLCTEIGVDLRDVVAETTLESSGIDSLGILQTILALEDLTNAEYPTGAVLRRYADIYRVYTEMAVAGSPTAHSEIVRATAE